MKKFIGIIILIGIIIIIIRVSSSGTPEPAPTAKEPVKIGAALMLTGPTALLGELQKGAIAMAVEKINKDGGINGRPLEVIIEDAAYDPKTAVSAYQALKLKGLKNFIIDGSSVVAATHSLVVSDGNFSIAGVATAPSYFDGSNRTCRIGTTARNIGPTMKKIALSHGYKKVALLLPDNEYGRGFADEYTKAFSAEGGTVVISEFYSSAPGVTDLRTNITKIKAAQAGIDAIIFSNILNSVEPTLKQIKEIGITKPLISDFPTLTNPALKDLSLMEGVEFADIEYSQYDKATDSQETKDFKTAYRAKFNAEPIYFTASQYDITLLLAKAITTVGEEPGKIADYISSLKEYQGITGMYSFDSDCEVSRKEVVSKVVGGKFVEVK